MGFKVKTLKRYLEDWKHQLEIQLKTRLSSLNRGEKYSRFFLFSSENETGGDQAKEEKSPNRHVDFSYSRKLGVCDTYKMIEFDTRKDFLAQ